MNNIWFLEVTGVAIFTLLTSVVFTGWVIPLISLIGFIVFGIVRSIQGSKELKIEAERQKEEHERQREEYERRREEYEWAREEHQARMLHIKGIAHDDIETKDD